MNKPVDRLGERPRPRGTAVPIRPVDEDRLDRLDY